MRIRAVQILALLVAVVSFIMAFIAAGLFLVSAAFMVVGVLAVGWLAWSLIRRITAWGSAQRLRQRRRDSHPA